MIIPDPDMPSKKSKMNQNGVKPETNLLAEESYWDFHKLHFSQQHVRQRVLLSLCAGEVRPMTTNTQHSKFVRT